MAHRYYQVVVKKLTFREITRIANNSMEFVLATIIKILRIPVPLLHANAYPEELIPVSPSSIPAHIEQRIGPIADEVRAIGVAAEFVYTVPSLGPTEGYGWAALMKSDPSVIASISLSRTDAATYIDEKIDFGFGTLMQDGRYLSTKQKPSVVTDPPELKVVIAKLDSVSQLFARHRSRVENDQQPSLIRPGQLEAVVLEMEQRVFDYAIKRGLLKELPKERVDQLRRGNQTIPDYSDASTNQPARNQPARNQSGTQGWEMMFWIITCFGIFMMRNPAANPSQLIFRISILAVGLLGAVGLMVHRLVKSTKH